VFGIVVLGRTNILPIYLAGLLVCAMYIARKLATDRVRNEEILKREQKVIDANWEKISRDWRKLGWYLEQEEITRDLRLQGLKARNSLAFPTFDTCPDRIQKRFQRAAIRTGLEMVIPGLVVAKFKYRQLTS